MIEELRHQRGPVALAAAIGLPLFAFGTIIPCMGLVAILAYAWYRAVCARHAALATEPAE